MPRMKRVIFYLASEQYERLSGLAQEQSKGGERVSVAHIMRLAISEYLAKIGTKSNDDSKEFTR